MATASTDYIEKQAQFPSQYPLPRTATETTFNASEDSTFVSSLKSRVSSGLDAFQDLQHPADHERLPESDPDEPAKTILPRAVTSKTTFNASKAATLVPSLNSRNSSGLDASPNLQHPATNRSYTSTQQSSNEKSSTGSAAFQAAYTKFRAKLPGNQLVEFQKTSYEQLCQEIIRIQHEQESKKKMMNLARIQGCLEAMNQFGKTVEVFLNVSDAVAFVWGPIKFLLLVSPARVFVGDASNSFCVDSKQFCRLFRYAFRSLRADRRITAFAIRI